MYDAVSHRGKAMSAEDPSAPPTEEEVDRSLMPQVGPARPRALSDDVPGPVAGREVRLGHDPLQLTAAQQPEGIALEEDGKLHAGRAGVEHDDRIGHDSTSPGMDRGRTKQADGVRCDFLPSRLGGEGRG